MLNSGVKMEPLKSKKEQTDSAIDQNRVTKSENSEKPKPVAKLSFGISRILDKNDKCTEERHVTLSEDEDDEPRNVESPQTEKKLTISGYSSIPSCIQPMSYVPFGLCGMPSLALPGIPRPNPVVPVLSSYTFPGWVDLRRDRYSSKYF